MSNLTSIIGLIAAVLTTGASVPQVIKSWRTRSSGDLSIKMILVLASGLSCWVIYGFLTGDRIIIVANGTGVCLQLTLLWLRLRYGT